jgi:type IV pilus assembly protein PilO
MDLGLERIQTHLEKLGRMPKRQRVGLVVALVIGVFASYTYFFYMPARQQLAALEGREQKLQREVSELKAIVSNLEVFQEELARLELKLTHAVRQLPDSKELPVLLTDISSLGKDAGLEFKAFRPQQEVPHDFYAEVPIEIEFNGQYHDIARFFDRVAKLPRIVNVGRLEMRIGGERFDGTSLVVRGEATTFRFLDRPNDGTASRGGSKQPQRGAHGGGGRA